MIALLKLLLSGVAAEKGVAVLIDAVAEVLTGHADAGSLPTLKLAVIDKVPFLHKYPKQYACTSTGGWFDATDIPASFRAEIPQTLVPTTGDIHSIEGCACTTLPVTVSPTADPARKVISHFSTISTPI